MRLNWLSILLPCRYTVAFLMNFTVDDTYGDPTTNRNISYFPEGAWRDGVKCRNCTAHLEASNVHNRSWTESLFDPLPDCGDATIIPSASVVFNGTAVYVLCAIAQLGSHSTNSNMTFLIDGKVAGIFSRASSGPAGYEYNVTVFSETSLIPGPHNLTIQNGHVNGPRSLVLLDSILYTRDIGQPIAGPPGLTPPNIIPPSTTPPSKTPTIVGGVLGGVGALLLLAITILLWRCYRRRYLVAGPRVSRDKTSWQRNIPIPTIGHSLFQTSSPCTPFLAASSHHFAAHPATDPAVTVSPLSPSSSRHSRSIYRPGILMISTDSSKDETTSNDAGPAYTTELPSNSNGRPPERRASVSSPRITSNQSPATAPRACAHPEVDSAISAPLARRPRSASHSGVPVSRTPYPTTPPTAVVPGRTPMVAGVFSDGHPPTRHASISSPQPIATTQPLKYAKKIPQIIPVTLSSPNPTEANVLDSRTMQPQPSAAARLHDHDADIYDQPNTSSLVTRDVSRRLLHSLETFPSQAVVWPRFTHSRFPVSRVVFSEHLQTNSFACLPLIDAQVNAMALDVSSRVNITQVYLNEASSGTGPARFMFSVPQNATICAFETRKSNGEVTTWKARASEDGPHQHEIEGQNTFIMPVGSIPSNGTIEVKLNYVASLFSDNITNLDDIRFNIPAHAGKSFGPHRHSTKAEGKPVLRIRVDIQTAGHLIQVISPSHGIERREQIYTTNDQDDTFCRRRTKIVYESTNFLSKDFVLSIQAEGLDGPRCFAEPLVRDEHSHHGLDTVAFCLTVVPKSVIPRLPLQEYLFVVDRSTSMRGSRIEIAKETLCKLLQSLPSEGTKFNVLSFAQHVDQHRPQSIVFKPQTLSNALTYVRDLTTDQSGTNIRGALQAAFRRSDRAMPTSIFLLTDGEAKATDREETLEDVRVAVQAASASAPIRVFTLGIGVTVAKDLCMAMAKTGNGACLLAPHADGIWSQCTRLFHAGGAPFIAGVAIDWGILPENLQSKSPGRSMASIRQDAAASALQQSPSLICDLHAGSRFCVYAIASVKEISVLQAVTITGQIGDHGEHFEVVVPVHLSELEDTDPGTLIIHTLAARELIREYDEQSMHNKAATTQLGETYNIETRHTSFVAIAKENMVNGGAEDVSLRCSRSSGGSYETADTAFSDTRSPWFGLVELPGET